MEGEMEMKREKKIVVAVDESEESMNALHWCLTNLITNHNSPSHNSTLVLLYVKPPPPVYSSFTPPAYMFSRDVLAAIERYGSDLVNSVMKRAEAVYRKSKNDVKVEQVVGSGDAKDVICNTVEKLRADTLVMGSHGYGFLQRAFLGSVSDHCAKHVKCPVVIVKK